MTTDIRKISFADVQAVVEALGMRRETFDAKVAFKSIQVGRQYDWHRNLVAKAMAQACATAAAARRPALHGACKRVWDALDGPNDMLHTRVTFIAE